MGLAQRSHLCECKCWILHFHLRSKHAGYEIEGVSGVEDLVFGHELVFFDQLEVEDVIDQAEEQVDLRDYNFDQVHGLGRDVLIE